MSGEAREVLDAVVLAASQRGRRRLSVDEVQYVLDHMDSTAMLAMARHLGVSWETLAARMGDMGIEVRVDKDFWSDADVARMRVLADEGKSLSELAAEFGRTENAIRMLARKRGITIYQPGRVWSSEDLDYLRRNWGHVSLGTIARHVRRPKDCVIQQAHKMRLGPVYGSYEDISLADFIRATDISRDRILGTLYPKYGFPLVKRKYGSTQFYWFVDFERILDWMEEHQDLYDGSRISDDLFIEPDWLRAKKLRDMDDNTYLSWDVRRSYWTEDQVSSAWTLFGLGLSFDEIGARIGRSGRAVMYKLGLSDDGVCDSG